jgi:hypothetical protein
MNMQTVVGLAGLGVSFALMYPTLLATLSLSIASPYGKAESRLASCVGRESVVKGGAVTSPQARSPVRR